MASFIMRKRIVYSVLLIILAAALCVGGYLYFIFNSANINKTGKLYIPSKTTYAQVVDSLQPFLKNKNSFKLSARLKHFDRKIHSGRYTLTKGMSNRQLLNLIAMGKQDEIAIRIGNYTSIFEMAGRVALFLECDSQQIVSGILKADYRQGMDVDDLLYFFIPNTYNFHWDITGVAFANKMKSYFDQFWNEKRKTSANELNMTPLQVTILASIVQLESSKPVEQPRVARLYLNRLDIGMKLDADPTVIFALKKTLNQNTKIDRVYYKYLTISSPYNTYIHKGLPPGPICMPNPSAIDAVLHPANHDYLYFVADPKRPGYHIFAYTLSEQRKNEQKYHEWVKKWQQQQKDIL